MSRRLGPALIVILAYAGLTLLFTYPLAWHFGTHHVGEDGGDARVYLWNYWLESLATVMQDDEYWSVTKVQN